MHKRIACLVLTAAGALTGCHESPSKPATMSPGGKGEAPMTAAPTTKPGTAKPVAAVAPEPTPAAPWDGPVDGRPVFMKVRAEGVQIYECKKSGDGYAWTLKAPEALLYNDKGRAIGKHYAGPTWELADGSKVTAEKIAAKPADG